MFNYAIQIDYRWPPLNRVYKRSQSINELPVGGGGRCHTQDPGVVTGTVMMFKLARESQALYLFFYVKLRPTVTLCYINLQTQNFCNHSHCRTVDLTVSYNIEK